MKPGSVVVDLAAEAGGNIETIKPGDTYNVRYSCFYDWYHCCRDNVLYVNATAGCRPHQSGRSAKPSSDAGFEWSCCYPPSTETLVQMAPFHSLVGAACLATYMVDYLNFATYPAEIYICLWPLIFLMRNTLEKFCNGPSLLFPSIFLLLIIYESIRFPTNFPVILFIIYIKRINIPVYRIIICVFG